MVPLEKILEEAKNHEVDVIGLSGLITPSLDEMVGVAQEMERRQMDLPLLIGGATTSRVHTAVKIEPEYSGPVVHVLDASKSVPVVSKLISSAERDGFVETVREEYKDMRERRARGQKSREYVSIEEARKNRWKMDGTYKPKAPNLVGVKHFEALDVELFIPYIDWSPFFSSWQMKGKFPDILEHEVYGEEASRLHSDALEMLGKICEEGWLDLRASIGIFPAKKAGEDRVLVSNGKVDAAELLFLRQQAKKAKDLPNYSLSDFLAEEDHIGAFVVTAGHGVKEKVREFEEAHDDYSAILLKSLADRLAEAMAEYFHESVRKEYWGYASEEKLSNEALIKEEYKGIRPAPGYPACPEHTEKDRIWELLEVDDRARVQLTESYAMAPAASVCGWYFAHPESRYFNVGVVQEDQAEEYARAKGWDEVEKKKWIRRE